MAQIVSDNGGQVKGREYWGLKTSTNIGQHIELDFMHFMYEGHKILADTLLNHINNILSFE